MEFIKALIITAILIGFVTTVFGFIKMLQIIMIILKNYDINLSFQLVLFYFF